MGAKRQTRATRTSDGRAGRPILTTGETFPDGTAIELVSSRGGSHRPDLLLWNGTTATVASKLQYCGHIYQGPELAPSLYRAIRLPAACTEYGSLHDLFSGIAELFNHYLHFPDRESRLLAAFSISSWLADRLPTAPAVLISALDEGTGIALLRLLSCLCRRSMMLGEVTPASFRSLPMYLSPTLLIDQQAFGTNILRLFRASNFRGLHLPSGRGGVVDLYGPKVFLRDEGVAMDANLGQGLIHISVTPSQSQRTAFDQRVQEEIASSFQPRLLHYRLKNQVSLCDSKVAVPEFTAATRQLAGILGTCLAEDPELAQSTVQLLKPQDQDVREQYLRDVNCVVIEILLGLVHQQKTRAVRVEELSRDVNALLRSRGETLAYSAEEIGWTLKRLGIARHTKSSGREVLLSADTSKTIHRIAAGYGLQCSQRSSAQCQFCGPMQLIKSKQIV